MTRNEERFEIGIPRENRGGANLSNRRGEHNANDDRREGYVRNLANAAVGG